MLTIEDFENLTNIGRYPPEMSNTVCLNCGEIFGAHKREKIA